MNSDKWTDLLILVGAVIAINIIIVIPYMNIGSIPPNPTYFEINGVIILLVILFVLLR